VPATTEADIEGDMFWYRERRPLLMMLLHLPRTAMAPMLLLLGGGEYDKQEDEAASTTVSGTRPPAAITAASISEGPRLMTCPVRSTLAMLEHARLATLHAEARLHTSDPDTTLLLQL
jgi:hypothetical protein